MNQKPDHAFILTAGKGTRLRPYTDSKPKPMVEVNGRPILDHTLEKLKIAGVTNVTMNLFYLGDVIKKHFENYQTPKITFSQETDLLETGGGVKLALEQMGDKPFYLINGDALWDDTSNVSALDQLANIWNPNIMDILLLLQPVNNMALTKGVGDYNINNDGTIIRTPDQSGEHMFTGIRIVKPEVFKNTPEGAFSFLECMDKAQKNGTLHGVEYKGQWHHISTPKDLESVNYHYKNVQHKEVSA